VLAVRPLVLGRALLGPLLVVGLLALGLLRP
jgi:hypothetical protein